LQSPVLERLWRSGPTEFLNMAKRSKTIPPSVIRRLTKYLTHIQVVAGQGVEWVSSGDLANTLGLTSATVRQDLSHIQFSGISKRGYECDGLQRVLAQVLGADRTWNMAVVGAGNLGRALALHEEFPRRGFNIVGIFDCAPEKIGIRLGSLCVQSLDALPAFMQEHEIDMGVIAVPAAAAQEVCDLLVRCGVKGLLKLSLTHLAVPKRVCVVDSRIVASLLELAHSIKHETHNRR